ncbi:hypothetical protein [Chelatococcus asaccharovorans]|uniref:Uncharacterized protein n=1 Tax=Chelatococcus asaccharovorans TaxID=28210 RepID=A0A2V3U073_9HYPH|nr:hypothetical protein [Chelatococcus asaccharovorans]MBS7704741.1 hypothetical protein [Chelatococcus asaccharovorans]PXW54641.1 hypothetical protein C7450_111173 [Chelatococcus asaccharovorans]
MQRIREGNGELQGNIANSSWRKGRTFGVSRGASSLRPQAVPAGLDLHTHDFSKSGYTTAIEAKRKPGAVEDVG